MSGAELGGGRCQQCGGPISGKGRRDRKYCSASCRTVAWGKRAGKDASKASSRASSAKLDNRTVDRLADAVASRLNKTDGVSVGTRPDPPPVAAAPVIGSESEAIKQLQAEMAKLRTDLELSRASPSTTLGSKHATAVLRLLEESKLGSPSHQLASGQPRAAKLLAGAQAGGGTVAASTAQFEQLKASHRQELAAIDKDREQLTRNFTSLFLAHNRLETALENAATEKQSLSKRIRDLERQCEAAKAETEAIRKQLQSLRQVLSEEDPLLFLMRSKVNLQHRIAVGRESINPSAHGRRLPDEKPETQQSAAVYAAQAARQEFFDLHSKSRQDKATWLVEGRRLDSVSEHRLRKQEEKQLGVLERELSLTIRLREGR